jgi:prephenate dehydrogenase
MVQRMTVGILGGRGAFGQWCAQLFERHGFAVQIADCDPQQHPPVDQTRLNQALVQRSQIVVVTVPIGETEKVLAEVAAVVAPSTLVVELTSVKTPFEGVLARMPAPLLSLHPMFSPASRNPRGQRCVVCSHERAGAVGAQVLDLLSAEGITLVQMGPDRHDRVMAVVQGLTHVQAMTAAHCMAALGVDLNETQSVASPVYRIRLAMVGRVVAQNPRVYAEIQRYNPYVKPVLEQLLHSTQHLTSLLEQSDLSPFMGEMAEVRAAFGAYCAQALEESEALIGSLLKREAVDPERGT